MSYTEPSYPVHIYELADDAAGEIESNPDHPLWDLMPTGMSYWRWLMGDGHVRRARGQRMVIPAVRETRDGKRIWISGGERVWTDDDLGWDAVIFQAKPSQVTRIRALLARVPHTEKLRKRGGHLPEHAFQLRRAYTTDLLKRARWGEVGPEEFVLLLSPDQRAAWLTALIDAEGHAVKGYQPWHKDHVRIAQNPGPLLEAIKLAVYLEGFQPSVVNATRSGCKTVGMRSPHAALPGFSAPVVLGRQSAWCVTTGLGTWTMRQEGRLPCLTGDSRLLWQILGWTGRLLSCRAGAVQGVPGAGRAQLSHYAAPQRRHRPVGFRS